MLHRYYHHDPDNKSNQIVTGTMKYVRNVQLAGEDKGFRGKPISKKTCVEFLERDDNKPGFLTAVQRETLEKKAGNKYKKQDPFEKRKGESVEQYAKRISALVKGKR